MLLTGISLLPLSPVYVCIVRNDLFPNLHQQIPKCEHASPLNQLPQFTPTHRLDNMFNFCWVATKLCLNTILEIKRVLHCCGKQARHLFKRIFLLCTISLLENTSVFPWLLCGVRRIPGHRGGGLIKIELIPARSSSSSSHSEGVSV